MHSTSALAPQAPAEAAAVSGPHLQPASSVDSTQPLAAVATGERCASCGSLVASDQRYCLECGQRRGDPRLPFMDAVVFMNASAQRRRDPSPTPQRQHSRLSPSATLVGGIGTLLLAMGVGVLIGHSGSNGSPVVSGKPSVQVIKVPGAGAATASAPTPGTSTGKSAKAKATGHGGSAKKAIAPAAASGSGGGAANVLHPTQKLPPPTVKVGGTCDGNAAGCSNGKFTGDFFGE